MRRSSLMFFVLAGTHLMGACSVTGLRPVELESALRPSPVSLSPGKLASNSTPADDPGGNSLLGLSLYALGETLNGSFGEPAWISYDEVRLSAGRLRSDAVPIDVYGLGVDLSKGFGHDHFVRLGFWILEEDDYGHPDSREVGRLNLEVGQILQIAESTHLTASIGFALERSRQESVNFLSLTSDHDKGLFGSRHDQFGGTVEVALRQRLGKYLQIDTGLRGETLRRDAEGYFVAGRAFLTRNLALFAEYSDTDEQQMGLGIAIVP